MAVVAPGIYGEEHPRTAFLVIEVAVTSLTTDLQLKAPLYAAARVPEYWVVDVNAKCLHVFTDPRPGGYASRRTVGPGGAVRPQQVNVAPLQLAELFAPR